MDALGSLAGTIDGGAGANTLAFTTDANDTVTVTAPQVTINGAAWHYTNIDDLSVTTLGGLDSITVNPVLNAFPGRVRVAGGTDHDDVIFNLLVGTVA